MRWCRNYVGCTCSSVGRTNETKQYQRQALKVTPLVWIFLAIISVLVLMIVLIGLVLRARCSKSSRQKAKFVRATDQHNTLLKEDRVNSRGNNPDLIPDTGQSPHLTSPHSTLSWLYGVQYEDQILCFLLTWQSSYFCWHWQSKWKIEEKFSV